MKFKIGDKVKIVHRGHSRNGHIGIIYALHPNHAFFRLLTDNDSIGCEAFTSLELVVDKPIIKDLGWGF